MALELGNERTTTTGLDPDGHTHTRWEIRWGNLCTARALRATFRLCSPKEPPSTPLGNALKIR